MKRNLASTETEFNRNTHTPNLQENASNELDGEKNSNTNHTNELRGNSNRTNSSSQAFAAFRPKITVRENSKNNIDNLIRGPKLAPMNMPNVSAPSNHKFSSPPLLIGIPLIGNVSPPNAVYSGTHTPLNTYAEQLPQPSRSNQYPIIPALTVPRIYLSSSTSLNVSEAQNPNELRQNITLDSTPPEKRQATKSIYFYRAINCQESHYFEHKNSEENESIKKLYIAIKNSNLFEVERLMGDKNCREAVAMATDTKHLISPLQVAAAKNQLAIVKAIIKYTDLAKQLLVSGHSENPIPLVFAIMLENVEMVQLFLPLERKQINLQVVNHGFPIHIAARTGNLEIIKLLLDQGDRTKQTTKKDNKKQNPLFIAVKCGHVGVVEFLLKENNAIQQFTHLTDVKSAKHNLLEWAELKGNQEIISLLKKFRDNLPISSSAVEQRSNNLIVATPISDDPYVDLYHSITQRKKTLSNPHLPLPMANSPSMLNTSNTPVNIPPTTIPRPSNARAYSHLRSLPPETITVATIVSLEIPAVRKSSAPFAENKE